MFHQHSLVTSPLTASPDAVDDGFSNDQENPKIVMQNPHRAVAATHSGAPLTSNYANSPQGNGFIGMEALVCIPFPHQICLILLLLHNFYGCECVSIWYHLK
jgi:hypothetical protein